MTPLVSRALGPTYPDYLTMHLTTVLVEPPNKGPTIFVLHREVVLNSSEVKKMHFFGIWEIVVRMSQILRVH